MGISRQAYYKRNRAADSREKQADRVEQYVRHIRMRQPRLGTRKLHHLLHGQPDRELHMGRDRLFQVLGERRLLVAPDGRTTRPRTAFIASIGIPIYSSLVRNKSFPRRLNTSGWRTLPTFRHVADRST